MFNLNGVFKGARNTLEIKKDEAYELECLMYAEKDITPERRLLVALLERSVADALFGVGRATQAMRYAREAYAWIVFEPINSKPRVYGYVWICLHLDIDPMLIRQLVLKARPDLQKFYRGKMLHRNKPLQRYRKYQAIRENVES